MQMDGGCKAESMWNFPNGCFYVFGVLFVDVLLIRAILFGDYIRAP